MKHLFAAILSLVLVGCSSTSEVNSTASAKSFLEAKPSDARQMVGMFLICRSLKAIQGVMAGDKISHEDAIEVLKFYTMNDLCRIYNPPIMGVLETRVEQYTDYDNKLTSIWKLKGEDLWTILINDSKPLMRENPQSQGQDT